ncbi:MAG: flagellar hook assembly protein FlgD [Gammaproteobacteria bacterium]|nr:flagellar hook assembly protein FlgD [Gammaproteobacteria bacterium]
MTSGVNETQAMLDQLGLSRKPEKKNSNELGADAFMKLMLTQMQNQDPLSPMENGEFLAQIAQFSTVSGIKELNTAFSGLSTAMQSNQALQASTLVGRTVLLPTDKAVLNTGSEVSGTVFTPANASHMKVNVYKGGELVHTIGLGEQPAGDIRFTWDGTLHDGSMAAPGTYELKAEASFGGEPQALETYVYDKVQSVDLGYGQGIRVNLAGLGTANFGDVIQIK